MALPFQRASELARNLRFTASFVARTLAEDPLWLGVQAARRAPEPVRRPLVRALGFAPAPSAPHALGRMLAGDTARAADEAEQLLARRDGRGRRVAAEVAVAVGRPELLDDVDAAGPARYRAAWLLGDADSIGPDAPAGLRAPGGGAAARAKRTLRAPPGRPARRRGRPARSGSHRAAPPDQLPAAHAERLHAALARDPGGAARRGDAASRLRAPAIR